MIVVFAIGAVGWVALIYWFLSDAAHWFELGRGEVSRQREVLDDADLAESA